MTPIKYVGLREDYVDKTFGSGLTWKIGEQQFVPDLVAAKMMQHPSVYIRGKGVARVNPEKDIQEEEDPFVDQDTLDSIAVMDVDSLSVFAKTYFNVRVDKRTSLATVRQNVTNMVNQFGMPK